MRINFPIFDNLLWGVGGGIFTVFLVFLIPITQGIIIPLLVAFIVGFLKMKYTSALSQVFFVGLFMGLSLIEIFFWGDIGGFILLTRVSGFLLEKLSINSLTNTKEIIIFSSAFVVLIVLSSLLGGVLAKLYQRVFKEKQ